VSETEPVCLPSGREPARLVERSSADLEETGVTLIAPARPATRLGPAAQLFVTDHRQYRPQVFVVSDGALVDVANLVEGAISELDPTMTDGKPAVGVVENGDVLTRSPPCFLTSLPTEGMTGSAAGSTRRSISPASTPRCGRMRHRHTWSISRCSATATTRTLAASAASRMSGLNGGEARTGCPCTRVERYQPSDCRKGLIDPGINTW